MILINTVHKKFDGIELQAVATVFLPVSFHFRDGQLQSFRRKDLVGTFVPNRQLTLFFKPCHESEDPILVTKIASVVECCYTRLAKHLQGRRHVLLVRLFMFAVNNLKLFCKMLPASTLFYPTGRRAIFIADIGGYAGLGVWSVLVDSQHLQSF